MPYPPQGVARYMEVGLSQIYTPFFPKVARYHGNPVLTIGGAGAWDDQTVIHPCVLWDDVAHLWKMWYCGAQIVPAHLEALGYATSPDGITWTKDAGNPILSITSGTWEGPIYFGHNFMVRKFGNTDYRLWYESGLVNDFKTGYATSTDGITWVKHPGNPVIDEELDFCSVFLDPEGNYHIIGSPLPHSHYRSVDGISWVKIDEINLEAFLPHKRNIVGDIAVLSMGGYYLLTGVISGWSYVTDIIMFASPDLKHFQYLGTLLEDPGTTNYMFQEFTFCLGRGQDWRAYFQSNDGAGHDTIALSYLLLPKAPLPIIDLSTLALAATSGLGDCTEIPLEGARTFAITVACTYDGAATAGITVHVRTSVDGVNYDTEDWDSWTPTGFAAGATIRQTKHYDADVRWAKVLIENLDAAKAVTDIGVTAVLEK